MVTTAVPVSVAYRGTDKPVSGIVLAIIINVARDDPVADISEVRSGSY